MDNILPKFSKSLEDWERNIKDYNASLLELHQHLIKTTSETCEARLKLMEAMNSITSFLKDTDYMRENPISIPIKTSEQEHDIDEAEIAHSEKESEIVNELNEKDELRNRYGI